MSVADVESFAEWLGGEADVARELAQASSESIVSTAAAHGFEFTEADLARFLKDRLYAARSLPRPWGWPLARRLGLVRS